MWNPVRPTAQRRFGVKPGSIGASTLCLLYPTKQPSTVATATSASCQQRKSPTSPRISHHALAGVAAGDIGELALEGGGRGPAVQPSLLGGGRNESCGLRLPGAG